ncbi:MAG: DinB family protein [Gemmatimonadota bacterium]
MNPSNSSTERDRAASGSAAAGSAAAGSEASASAVRDIALRLLERELSAVEREIVAYPDDQALWQAVPGLANAGGNLALHLAGNLRHYVGVVLGGSSFVRDRDAEFSARGMTRADVAAQVRDARAQVVRALQALPPEQLERTYPVAVGNGVELRTDLFLMHIVSHAAYHLGQIDYHRRAATGDGTTVGTLPLAALAVPMPTIDEEGAHV